MGDAEQILLDDAKHADIPQLVKLLTVLFTEEEEFTPDPAKQESALRLLLDQPLIGRIFVARRGVEIVGMVSLLFTVSTAMGGPAILLEDMVLSPTHRHAGIGTILLKHAISFSVKNNYYRITLLTDRPNEKARRFYERHGFTASDMLPMRLILKAHFSESQ